MTKYNKRQKDTPNIYLTIPAWLRCALPARFWDIKIFTKTYEFLMFFQWIWGSEWPRTEPECTFFELSRLEVSPTEPFSSSGGLEVSPKEPFSSSSGLFWSSWDHFWSSWDHFWSSWDHFWSSWDHFWSSKWVIWDHFGSLGAHFLVPKYKIMNFTKTL